MECQEMDENEKTELPEVDVDMDNEKKGRRSSILKPQKPRNPLSTLDFSEINSDTTLARASRRVSFASSNFVKPFVADPEKNTIWDTTYEEEVNHTDSTKSSYCDQTHGTKTSDLNMTSIYSTTQEDSYDEKFNTPSCSTEYINVDVARVQISDVAGTCSGSLVLHARNLVSYSKTKLSETAMDITACLTDKENVNPLINDLSIVVPNLNNFICNDETKYFTEEDLEFTIPLNRNEEANEYTTINKSKRETILFNEAEGNMEITNLTDNIDVNPIYFSQNMLFCNRNEQSMERKIDVPVSTTNIEIADMELTNVLSNMTVTEKDAANYGNEENWKLASAMSNYLDETKRSESSMEFTRTLAGKIAAVAPQNDALVDDAVNYENKENFNLASAMSNYLDKTKRSERSMELTTPFTNMIAENQIVEVATDKTMELTISADNDLKPCDMSLTRNLRIRSVDSNTQLCEELPTSLKKNSKSRNVNVTIPSDTNTDILELNSNVSCTKSGISGMNLRDCKISSFKDLDHLNVIYSQKKSEREIQPMISKNVMENAQSHCSVTDRENIENNLPTISVNGGTTDIKRHIGYTDEDVIKKRRIQESLLQDEYTIRNSLSHINEHLSTNQVELINEDNSFVEIKPEISTNQETNLKTSGGNVLYSELLKPTTTPATSFHINLSFSKPETLKMLNDNEPSCNSLHKADISKTEEIYLSMPSPHKEISTNERLHITTAGIKEKTLIQPNLKSTSSFENTQGSNYDGENEMDDSLVKFVNGSHKKSNILLDTILPELHSPAIPSYQTDIDNIPKDDVPIEEDDSLRNCSSDSVSTIRAQTVINNIQNYLLRYEPETQTNDLLQVLQSNAKKIKDTYNIIRDRLTQLKTKKHAFVLDLEELHKQNEEALSGQNEAIVSAEDEAKPPSTAGLAMYKSLSERICEAGVRAKKFWEFVKEEEGYYYFYTLFGTLPLKVNVHPELGTVYGVKTYTNLSDIAKPICHYQLKQFQHRLKQENLVSVLSRNYDIFTLLDYIYMSMEEIVKFNTEYFSLVKKYGETHHFRMNQDLSITIEIMRVRLRIWWTITVKLPLSSLSSITKEDITAAYNNVGLLLNEEHIKTIAENTPKGPNFFRNFIENVDEYANRIGRRIRR